MDRDTAHPVTETIAFGQRPDSRFVFNRFLDKSMHAIIHWHAIEAGGAMSMGGNPFNLDQQRLLDNANVSYSNIGRSGSTGPNTGLKRS